jgi:hypothetical protein
MLAEAAQQLGRCAFLRSRETSHHGTKPIDVSWEYLVHQRSPLGCEFAEDDPLVFRGRSPPHQSTLFELLDHVCRARSGDEDPIPNLAKRQSALVLQHLEDRELSHAQPILGEMWSHSPLNRLHGSAERNDQSQRRPIAIGVRLSLFMRPRRHYLEF